jgi:hypothetical protein
MLKTYQSIYVVSHRWMFKNFGQGKAQQGKISFNASFLLIIVLTTTLLSIDLLLHSGIITANPVTHTVILLAMVALMFVNHLVFLNNKLVRKVDARLTIISRRSRNLLAIVVLVHIIIICGLLIFTVS